MQRNVTTSVILKRINFNDADRIITCITPDFGKVSLLARGVRKSKSKMAGGIELFSINQITFIPGKKEIGTLVSARIQTNFGQVVKDVERAIWAYEMLKITDQHTEENAEPGYYQILTKTLVSLDNHKIDLSIAKVWFYMQFLNLSGHGMNLASDIKSRPLVENTKYQFSVQDGAFFKIGTGQYDSNHIKFLRLCIKNSPNGLNKISYANKLAHDVENLLLQQIKYLH